MKNLNLVFFITLFLILGCHPQQNDKAKADKAVNLAGSEGCGGEKSKTDSDEVSFSQSSKLESQNSEDELFNEERKSDSGCTL